MSTKVHGSSDDHINFDGEFIGQVDCYGTDERGYGVLLMFSDLTLAEVKYGKNDRSIWEIKIINKGLLFDCLELCTDEDADIYSDVLYLHKGIKWVYAAKQCWEKVT